MRNMFKFPNEKGAVIVFFAITLPLFLMLVGGAIDFGNAYIHKSRLQNAADAAALAGARVFAIKGETIYSHTEADREAGRYVAQNAESSDGSLPSVINTKEYKAGSKDNVIYYKVHLTEEVPFYFLRIIGDRFKTIEIAADAVATITAVGGYDYQPNQDLFIFRRKLKVVNSIENPDNYNIKGQLRTTFDGNVAFTDGHGNNSNNANNYEYEELHYTTQYNSQVPPLSYFFTEKARNENMSVNEAISMNSDEYARKRIFENYDMDRLGEDVRKQMGLEEYSKITNWDEYRAMCKNKGQLGTITSDELSESMAITANGGDGNIDITIDGKIPGSSSEPVYLYLDESIYNINLNVNTSNERPLIFIYTGTGKLHVNFSSGNTFTGILYAPNVPGYDEFLINNNNGIFEGTIIANYLDIEGGTGTYRYKNFHLNSGGGNDGANGHIVGNARIKLNIPADDITWY